MRLFLSRIKEDTYECLNHEIFFSLQYHVKDASPCPLVSICDEEKHTRRRRSRDEAPF